MKRILVLSLVALALLGLVAPAAFAQAPTPKVTINGLIDNVGTYTRNMSTFDGNIGRNQDYQFYGRTRGRFDFIGEVGKAKGVLGIEIDSYYGQTGLGDSNGQGSTTCVTSATGSVACGTQGAGAESGFDLNTDTQSNLQIKWLYAEFPVPLIPVPTIMRLGGQPFGSAASYKLAAYAQGDFGGVNIVSTVTPDVKLNLTYVGVEELLTGKKDITATTNIVAGGVPFAQSRGDDYAVIFAPEVTPVKGLDIKPMVSFFSASGLTSANARQGRGGQLITQGGPFAPNPGGCCGADGVGTGINEHRYTVGLDARWRWGAFSLDPTVMYQFGNRQAAITNTGLPAGTSFCNGGAGCTAATVQPGTTFPAGTVFGLGYTSANHPLNSRMKADISAWLVDVRAGYQMGPLLFQGLVMWTSGQKAQSNPFKDVNYYQPLDTDTSYMADWGTQIMSLGVDYYQIINGGAAFAGLNPGVAIGYDKYGRLSAGVKASYALTPALTFGAGVTYSRTDKSVDTDSINLSNGGLLPSAVCKANPGTATAPNLCRPDGDSADLGWELNAAMTWRFADGLAFDFAAGYLLAGNAWGHRNVSTPYNVTPASGKDGSVQDVILTTARVRYTF